jgi:hypothetical protein
MARRKTVRKSFFPCCEALLPNKRMPEAQINAIISGEMTQFPNVKNFCKKILSPAQSIGFYEVLTHYAENESRWRLRL